MKNIPERQKDILSIISSLDISPTMYRNAVEKYKAITKFLGDCGIEAQVEYVTDIMRVMEYNVMSTPAVVVDGEVKIKGSVPTEADVKKALGL